MVDRDGRCGTTPTTPDDVCVLGAWTATGAPFNDVEDSIAEDGQRPLLLTAAEAARALAIGRSTLYELIGAGAIDVVHIGRSARIRHRDLERFVEQLSARGGTVSRDTQEARAELELDPGQPAT